VALGSHPPHRYPELHAHEFIQNKVPKVDADSLQPASWAAAAAQEWCPPGHGDLYAAIAGSGTLNELLAAGYKYLFVSNSDNLGATLDLDILTYFAQSDTPFMMEVHP
jgi:UDP-N-acetylglucosamine pyrophosphorylase